MGKGHGTTDSADDRRLPLVSSFREQLVAPHFATFATHSSTATRWKTQPAELNARLHLEEWSRGVVAQAVARGSDRKANTAMLMATPGNKIIHGAWRSKFSGLSATASGPGRGRLLHAEPRNDSEASAKRRVGHGEVAVVQSERAGMSSSFLASSRDFLMSFEKPGSLMALRALAAASRKSWAGSDRRPREASRCGQALAAAERSIAMQSARRIRTSSNGFFSTLKQTRRLSVQLNSLNPVILSPSTLAPAGR